MSLFTMVQKNVKLDMYSLAYLSASSATPGGTLFTDGDLVLNQRSPITDRLYNDNYNAPLLSSSNPSQQLAAQASTELQFETILKSYLDHNYTTYYTNHYPVWKAGTGNTFELQMRIRIPPNQLIWYRPQVIEMLKFGWIQFLATFVVLMWIVHYMEVFIFRYRLVGTRIMSDTQPRGQKF